VIGVWISFVYVPSDPQRVLWVLSRLLTGQDYSAAKLVQDVRARPMYGLLPCVVPLHTLGRMYILNKYVTSGTSPGDLSLDLIRTAGVVRGRGRRAALPHLP
jgi:hypothetical protein